MTHQWGKIVVSGASGMLGSALRRALAARGLPALQLVRRPAASAGELQWTPTANSPIPNSEPLEGCRAVVHLSGANLADHSWTEAYKREMAASRVDSTQALSSTLARLRFPPQALLVASAVGYYGDRGDELLDETSKAGSGFLSDLCQRWEAAAQPAHDVGIRVVHLRFGVVLGPGSGAMARLAPVFRLGMGGPLGSGRQWMSWIGLSDAVAAILFALETPSVAGPVNLTAPNPVTNREFTHALARQLHRPAWMPALAFALRMALGAMADETLLSSARVFPSRLATAGFHFAQATIHQALAGALS